MSRRRWSLSRSIWMGFRALLTIFRFGAALLGDWSTDVENRRASAGRPSCHWLGHRRLAVPGVGRPPGRRTRQFSGPLAGRALTISSRRAAGSRQDVAGAALPHVVAEPPPLWPAA